MMKFTTLVMGALCMPGVLAAASVAHAQTATVWRCGADARSYSSTPCAEGRLLNVGAQARPDADVQAATQLADQDRREADRLRHDRLREEAHHGSGLVGIGKPKQAAPISKSEAVADRQLQKARKPKTVRPPSPLHQLGAARPAEAGTWQAAAPGSRRKKG